MGLFFVDFLNGEAGMKQNVIAFPGVIYETHICLAPQAVCIYLR